MTFLWLCLNMAISYRPTISRGKFRLSRFSSTTAKTVCINRAADREPIDAGPRQTYGFPGPLLWNDILLSAVAEVWEGGCAPPQKIIYFFNVGMMHLGWFWCRLCMVREYDHCKISGCSRTGSLTIAGPWYTLTPPEPPLGGPVYTHRKQAIDDHYIRHTY